MRICPTSSPLALSSRSGDRNCRTECPEFWRDKSIQARELPIVLIAPFSIEAGRLRDTNGQLLRPNCSP